MNKGKILVVDDEPVVRNFIKSALENDYEIETAEDAGKALSVMEEASDISLLITDYKMPGMDCVKFLEIVEKRKETDKEKYSFFPNGTIVMSGTSDEYLVEKLSNFRVKKLLNKPIRLKVLLNEVEDTYSKTEIRN